MQMQQPYANDVQGMHGQWSRSASLILVIALVNSSWVMYALQDNDAGKSSSYQDARPFTKISPVGSSTAICLRAPLGGVGIVNACCLDRIFVLYDRFDHKTVKKHGQFATCIELLDLLIVDIDFSEIEKDQVMEYYTPL